MDPRLLQILILSSLWAYSALALGVSYQPSHVLAVLLPAISMQIVCSQFVGLQRIDLKSTLISSLSLILLLKSGSVFPLVFAALITIGSKFALRVSDRHVFNPTNFGIVVCLVLFPETWLSPGQWGREVILVGALAFLGFQVTRRAARSDITYAFILSYSGLLLFRAWWLGDPVAIPLHQLTEGALLIFAFLMISDPKTTPDSRIARIGFGFAVAALGVFIRFEFYEPAALLFALVILCPIVPALNYFLRAKRFEWREVSTQPFSLQRSLS